MLLDHGDAGDRLLERDAIVSISASIVQGCLRQTERRGNHQAALELELLHEQLPAHASLADALFFGDHHVVKELVNEGNGLLTNLLKRGDREAFGIVGYQPKRILFVLVAWVLVLRNNHGVERKAAKRDPGLLAVQEVRAIGLFARDAGHRVVVRSSGGLGDGGTGDAGALNVLDGVHDQLLLLFRAKVDHVGDGIEVGNEGEHHAGEFMELLNKEDLGELVDRDAADIFRKAHVHEPCLAVASTLI